MATNPFSFAFDPRAFGITDPNFMNLVPSPVAPTPSYAPSPVTNPAQGFDPMVLIRALMGSQERMASARNNLQENLLFGRHLGTNGQQYAPPTTTWQDRPMGSTPESRAAEQAALNAQRDAAIREAVAWRQSDPVRATENYINTPLTPAERLAATTVPPSPAPAAPASPTAPVDRNALMSAFGAAVPAINNVTDNVTGAIQNFINSFIPGNGSGGPTIPVTPATEGSNYIPVSNTYSVPPLEAPAPPPEPLVFPEVNTQGPMVAQGGMTYSDVFANMLNEARASEPPAVRNTYSTGLRPQPPAASYNPNMAAYMRMVGVPAFTR